MANELISIERLSDYNSNIMRDACILKRSTAYAVGNVVNKGFVYLKCTQAGTTASTTLNLSSVNIGDILTDGGVEWKVININGDLGGAGIYSWSASTPYVVNDYVLYDDVIYRCNTDHTSTSTFDATKWDINYSQIQVWTANTVYKVGREVLYNNSIYKCNTDHTSSSSFDVTKWDITYSQIPTWSANVEYKVGNEVLYDGVLYRCTTNHTSASPFDVTKWSLTYSNIREYATNTVYKAGSIVIYDNKLYKCVQNNTSTAYEIGYTEENVDPGAFFILYGAPATYTKDLGNEMELYKIIVGFHQRYLGVTDFDLEISTDNVTFTNILHYENSYPDLSEPGVTATGDFTCRYIKMTVNGVRGGYESGSASHYVELKDLTVWYANEYWEQIGGSSGSIGIQVWDTGIQYNVNDVVLYNNTLYICNTAHTSSTFSADASNWNFVYDTIQNWAASKYYKQGATVIYNNKLYQCGTAHTSTSTWDESKWQLIGDASGAGLEDWEANHDYAVDDIYVYEGEIYKTLIAFTSGATEDSRTKVNNIVPSVWAANTVYTAGDIIEHTDVTTLKKVYYNVTANFTSGATFEVTAQMQELQIVEEYVPNPLTKQQVKNLINNFVPSGSGTDPIFYNDTPIGTIISYMGITAPKDYLACDGQIYNIVDYKELAEYIKVQFGSYDYFGGDGTTTFAVPDLRGEFLRGTGTNSHTNQGNGSNVGTHQDSTEIPGGLQTSTDSNLYLPHRDDAGFIIKNSDSTTQTPTNVSVFSKSSTSSTITANGLYSIRPTNTSVLYCIKYNTSVLSTPENNYSTEEQRIGTWIDGKPLYQITIQDTLPTAITDGTFKSKEVDISNLYIKQCIKTEGFTYRPSVYESLDINSISSSNKFRLCETYASSGSSCANILYIGSSMASDSGHDVYITLQYTKTTD